MYTGFDLTTRDSCFTILAEVITNYILAKTNIEWIEHIEWTEWTEHKLTVLKPASMY